MRSVLTARSPLLRLVLAAASLLGLMTLLSGASGGGCSKEQQARLSSPVQVLANILGEPDGAVTAEVAVVSTADDKKPAYVSNASVVLRVDGAEVALQSSGTGRWRTTNASSPALKLAAGTHYNFQTTCSDATLCDPVKGKVLIGEVDAPAAKLTSLTVKRAPTSTLDSAELTFAPAPAFGQVGLLRVWSPDGAIVWDGFDLSSPAFDGSKYAHLVPAGIKTVIVPAESFAKSGTYKARLYLMAQTAGFDGTLSSGLGILSGFRAGAGMEVAIVVP